MFLADMGPKPGKNFSVERRKNHLGYSPSNCYWAARKVQARNKRNNRLITVNGLTKTLAEWSELTGLNYVTIISRIDRDGLSPEEALKPGMRAKKTTVWIEFNGERLSLTDWARHLGCGRNTLKGQISRLGVERALTMPRTHS